MIERYQTVIVGGGLVGMSIAFGMRALGARLAVLDDMDARSRPSRGNFGLVWVQGKGAGLTGYGAWTQASARAWPRLAAQLLAETGIDVGLQCTGGLHACLSLAELKAREAHLHALFAQPGFEPHDLEMLDRDAIARRVPGIGSNVVGGSFCAQDAHCNPLRLLSALHAAAMHKGVVYRPRHRVRSIQPCSTGFVLEVPQGRIYAERLVLAAGIGNARLAPMVGMAAPLKASKGQVIVLGRTRPMLPFPFETIRQTDDGTLLIGSSREDRDDDALDQAVLGAMARRAIDMLPALARLDVIRAWAALRVMSPDGGPVYAQSSTHPGAFAIACHSGVTLSAIHAFALAPALAQGALPVQCATFSPARFADVLAAA